MINKGFKKAIALCILATSINSYFTKPAEASPKKAVQNSEEVIGYGTGIFIYQDYKPFADRPIKIRYYNPTNKLDAPILFVMHGNGRNAQSYFDSMLIQAKKYNFLLIVPEFDEVRFPSIDYHHGGVLDKDKNIKSRESWTFSIIEPIFDYVKKHTGNTSSGYMLYGFSAGSQFVHRFLMFNPDNRVTRAISGSAGTYTMPDYSTNYSYGLKNVDLPQKNLNKFYAKDFRIVIGDADTVLSRPDLVKTPAANKQGRDRVERGLAFYEHSKKMAEKQHTSFNWKPVRLIAHAGHSQGEMSESVAKLLFEDK